MKCYDACWKQACSLHAEKSLASHLLERHGALQDRMPLQLAQSACVTRPIPAFFSGGLIIGNKFDSSAREMGFKLIGSSMIRRGASGPRVLMWGASRNGESGRLALAEDPGGWSSKLPQMKDRIALLCLTAVLHSPAVAPAGLLPPAS